MTEKFNSGDRVFLDSGESAFYVTADSDGHIVRPEIEHGDDGDTYPGTPMLASRVFSTPPKERLDASIAVLREQESGVRASLMTLRKEVSETERLRAAQLKDFERYPNLNRLVSFIEGRITHVVRGGEYGSVKIQTFKECFECTDDDKRPDGLKLVSLLGKPWNGFEWHMNHYKDGSGSYEQIVPCESYEEALTKAQGWLDAKAADWRTTGKAHWVAEWVKSAKALGLVVPSDLAAHVRTELIKAAQARVQKTSEDMTAAQNNLVELEATR